VEYQYDLEKYDLLKNIDRIKSPVLMMVNREDRATPLKYQQLIYDNLVTKDKKLVVFE
jgi:esterase/lipase